MGLWYIQDSLFAALTSKPFAYNLYNSGNYLYNRYNIGSHNTIFYALPHGNMPYRWPSQTNVEGCKNNVFL